MVYFHWVGSKFEEIKFRDLNLEVIASCVCAEIGSLQGEEVGKNFSFCWNNLVGSQFEESSFVALDK